MSMILILKNLPTGFTHCELKSLVRQVIEEIANSNRPSIPKTEVRVQFDRMTGEFEFYGLIYCNGRQHGQAIWALFENFLLKGYAIEVAEFFHRQLSWASLQTIEPVDTFANRRRIPDQQLLTFKSIEEIELFPAAEPGNPKCLH
jgi:hypothetical protein